MTDLTMNLIWFNGWTTGDAKRCGWGGGLAGTRRELASTGSCVADPKVSHVHRAYAVDIPGSSM